MGKVGSTSVEDALPEGYHFHTLYNNHPCPYFNLYIHGKLGSLGKAWFTHPWRRFQLRGVNAPLKIISLVRDPVKRNLSMFFQDLPYWIAEYVKIVDRETRYSDVEWLWRVYQSIFNHDYCLTWFDREIKRFSGIDVMGESFDTSSGAQLYVKGAVELLLLKTECLNENKEILENFVGRSLKLNTVNVGEDKWYGSIYKDFVDQYYPQVLDFYRRPYQEFGKKFGYADYS